MKIVTVIGARPQFVKAAVVSRWFEKYSGIVEIIIHTGQHYDVNMSDVFFEEMRIPKPTYNLEVGGTSHGAMTGQQLEKIESILFSEAPDYLLVYGDTNSTLAGALAAAKMNIPVIHIEAGLRSFNKEMPEEINRILTDHMADILLAPTSVAKENLISEGISAEKIFVVGDVMYDAALYYKNICLKPDWFDTYKLKVNEFVLCTIHRADNTDNVESLNSILRGLASTSMYVVLPLHPRTLHRINKFNISIPANVCVVEPVGYLEMVWLEINCKLVVTDSGGVQKEAYFHNKFCITLREETEWVELINSGYNVLVGADTSKISEELECVKEFKSKNDDFYGTGNAGNHIVNLLRNL
ncbi:non-hydrolyzing UDP-N-acetylglucosamine 2-epimerase [uncultured Shewanella sp.]|uniref:non-hydrolyzing UDP-N-acetylglucosamine 2-epimerase n=1 Tax=uncultured Shewanella sp. TaxID=173975 RepID=UPI0026145D1F|nr:UDP-N-acetylglucosamine 2-epimerase (non-hydrolyzing) [uncultured Shewanella sp.]